MLKTHLKQYPVVGHEKTAPHLKRKLFNPLLCVECFFNINLWLVGIRADLFGKYDMIDKAFTDMRDTLLIFILLSQRQGLSSSLDITTLFEQYAFHSCVLSS